MEWFVSSLSLPFLPNSCDLSLSLCLCVQVGEVYLGQSLAVIADPLIIPPRLLTTSVALFMLIITLIGGNSPLLIPFVQSTLSYDDVTVSFSAQSLYNTTTGKPLPSLVSDLYPHCDSLSLVPTTETFNVLNNNADLLLYSCLYSLIGCYALSGLLFLLSYLVMIRNK